MTRITAGSCFTSSVGDLVRERADVPALLEAANDLGGRGHADVRLQERFLEALPRQVVGRIEGGDMDLLGQRPARLRERVAQAREEAVPLRLRFGRRPLFTEYLRPAPRHRPRLITPR